MFPIMMITLAFAASPEMSSMGPDIARVQDPRDAIRIGMTEKEVMRLLPKQDITGMTSDSGGSTFSLMIFEKSKLTISFVSNKVIGIEKHGP